MCLFDFPFHNRATLKVRNPRVIKRWEYIILLFVKKQYCYTSDKQGFIFKFWNRKMYIVEDFVYNDSDTMIQKIKNNSERKNN